MKKTVCIQLVLITAALAACNRPLYQQAPYGQDAYDVDPYSYPADAPDSTNACPIESADLPPDYYTWLACFRPYGTITVQPDIYGFYYHRYHRAIIRSGFGGRTGVVHS
jgi:hypothetical protein